MPSTRSNKPLAASAAIEEPPATSSTRTPAAHRKRTAPTQFEAGVNPISKKEKKEEAEAQKTRTEATDKGVSDAPQVS